MSERFAMLSEADLEATIKILVIGDGCVGKSSLIRRFARGVYNENYKQTIGVDFLEKVISVDDNDARLMLWDTAGQEQFEAITTSYYRGGQACVVVFSTIDFDSFFHVEKWISLVLHYCPDIPIAVVENKIDLCCDLFETVARDESAALCQRLDSKLFRTSVKENINVDEVFTYLTREFMTKKGSREIDHLSPQIGCQQELNAATKNRKSDTQEIILDSSNTKISKKRTSFMKCNVL